MIAARYDEYEMDTYRSGRQHFFASSVTMQHHVRPAIIVIGHLWKDRVHTKEIAWLLYGLDGAVVEKNMRPGSKVWIVLRKASERTTSLRGLLWCPATTFFGLAVSPEIRLSEPTPC